MSITTLTDSDYDPIFKRNYDKLQDNLYNSFDNVYSRLPKKFKMGGSEDRSPVEVTFGGGVGSSTDGTLPRANNTGYLNPSYTAKRVYGRIEIDCYTIEASRSSEFAFVSAIDQETTGKMKSFNRNLARILFNDGTGILGQFSGSAGGTAAAPTMTILTTGNYGRRHACFEKGDFVNINSLSSVFEITAYNRSNGLLTLARKSGSDDLTGIGAGTHSIYMQNSKDADPYGLLGIHVNSTHYGVAEEFRWAPTETDASGAPLDTDMLTETIEKLTIETDESPSDIVMSPLQYRKYIALLEDQKRYPVPVEMKPRPNKMTSPDLIARVSFGGIQYVGSQGNINVMQNKFVRDDMVFILNLNKIVVDHMKKPGWEQKHGVMFGRMEEKDAYEARLKMYGEIKINPFHVALVHGLSVA